MVSFNVHNITQCNSYIYFSRMRHGKIGLQLGAHQKYYISQCEEKQSIQLTITIMDKDATCIRERVELIDDVAKLLKDIMNVFMPAAEKPILLIPCPKCSTLHITLKQVYKGHTIYCPLSNTDIPLYSYYSDLLPNSLTGETLSLISCCC